MNTILTEQTEFGEVPVDVYQKLADDRILFITGDITDQMASEMVATLLLKDAEDSNKKISIFISSEGGDIRSVFSITNTMDMIDSEIETVCIGSASNEAALILAAGSIGSRYIAKNSLMCVSPLSNNWMAQTDLTEAKQILELHKSDNKRFLQSMAKYTRKTYKQILEELTKPTFMTSSDVLKFGLADKIIKGTK